MKSSGWTSAISKGLRVLELDSIRNKILLFAVLATLLPSGITAWISYAQNRRALEAQITQELVSVTRQSAGELDLWLGKREQELRTFGGSGEISNALQRATGGPPTRGRATDYLNSLRGRFAEYSELLVLDARGQTIATTAHQATPVRLPPDWAKTLRTAEYVLGEAYWDEAAKEATLVLAVPLRPLGGSLLQGAFAATVRLGVAQQLLSALTEGTRSQLYLVSGDGSMILSSAGGSAGLMAAKLKPGTLERLTNREGSTVTYANPAGLEVVGTLKRVPGLPWATLAEISADTAYREVRRFRNLAMTMIFALLIVVSLTAYRLGLIVVRPLDRLTKGAAGVAAGDLAVDLPTEGGGEVGYLTFVFNHMVSQLRQSRKELDERNATLQKQNEELERLSTTDALTGLSNRRHLGQRLAEEAVRFRRQKHPFTVFMADVDHFKAYNDTHGHPAGDEVLKKVGQILRESVREVDCAARYGGEEFCVLLAGTSGDASGQVAERIRARIAAEKFPGRQITVSIGIAEFPRNGEAPEAVVAAADGALYQAKRAGRDRVVRAK